MIDKYSITHGRLNPILLGKNYSSITKIPYTKSTNTSRALNISKLTVEEVKKIKNLLKEKSLGGRHIAKMFNISESIVSEIRTGKIWKEIKE